MKTVAVLLDNPFTNDRRVLREVTALKDEGYKVVVFAVKSHDLPVQTGINGYEIHRIFLNDIYDIKRTRALKKYLRLILMLQPDIVHCHDQTMLQLGVMIKKRKPGIHLIYDSHELFHAWPLNISRYNDPILFLKSWIVRKILVHREKRNARKIDRLVTVNNSLARDLENYFHLTREAVVLRNIPEKQYFPVNKYLLKDYFSLPSATRLLVFIGSAIYPRTLNLEQVIMETAAVPDLAFIIICGEQGGKKEIMEWVEKNHYRHVYFHPKIYPDDIGVYLASCDVGLLPTWNKKDLSYWYALDNKLFEYMMSGIPVLSTIQPEYRAVVEKYGTGICVDPDQQGSYARGLIAILENIDSFGRPLEEAKNILNWEREKSKLIEMYSQIP